MSMTVIPDRDPQIDLTDLILRDGSQDFTGDQSLGDHKLTDLAPPTEANDAATKAYVDEAIGDIVIPEPDGGVLGPETTTDRAIPTWNGTDGSTLRNTGVRITSADKILGTSSAFPSVAAADGATITFNCNASNFFEVTLGGNRTLAVSGVTEGQNIQIALKQDGEGSRTVTWWENIYWPNGVVPTLTTTPGAVDVFGFRCIGVTPGYEVPIWRGSTHGLNYGG